jgi:hypothetical protein
MTRPPHSVSRRFQGKRGGAAEARRAHNPEVQGSKPCLAKKFFLLIFVSIVLIVIFNKEYFSDYFLDDFSGIILVLRIINNTCLKPSRLVGLKFEKK